MKHVLLICSLVCLSVSAFSQTGILRGTIRDGKTNEAVIGATVQIMGLATPMGGSTDVNGQFELSKVPAGTHTIQVSYVSYKTKTVPNVRIESGNATVLETDLLEDNQQLQEVVVKAGRTTNTEIAVVTEIKQIKAMAVGVSAQQIQKAQDRDAAAAIRRVPGVSIVDN
ncbi:MAG: TonB-dependent receptor, partial [Cytophagaceae bacterium]